ncbi:GNAT family N-acetyltransferase [Streptomyces sp. NPDC058691]|uniref:GNAT family N-acetyltransferase n=1 Tax=Streptomyces sp. NPDC058691 TaxID=3346601 RepID=UPI0036464138
MTTALATALCTFYDLTPVRDDLVAVYADVRADLLHLPNYAVSAFTERLDRHSAAPGFTAVLAYSDDGEPVGYAYAHTVEHADPWWTRVDPAPAEEYTAATALAVKELGVRMAWRKTGTARRAHDALLEAHPATAYASLMVNPAAGEGKVLRLYESWGYRNIGTCSPSPESPVLAMMVRPTHEG